jgi:acetate kinase
LLHELRELGYLDPTHMPQSLSVIDSMTRRFSNVPQFACFDTAFHHSMPDVAQCYPLPQWTVKVGVRRYGFHGLSCESIIGQLKQLDARAIAGRMLIAHLGNGASVTAVREGASVDTSMGFSPTGGLMMGTRSGDLDPTVVTFLARARAMTPDAVEKLVNEESGLLGVSGQTQDMRDLLERAASDSKAAEAIELYCYLARKNCGALTAVLGGVDTIVFTGGVGEHAAPIREKICAGLDYLGVQFHSNRNAANEGVISAENSRVVVRVIATDEDLVIARHVAALLTKGASDV